MMSGALEGIRILDFTRVLAGPLCTMILADLGAEVIKVEHPRIGDDTRQWGPPWDGVGDEAMSAYFLSVNRNKRSITLNLKTTEGRFIAAELAKKSHILIENFKVGQMAAYSLDYPTLQREHPALIYCSITGYGQSGPYSDRPGYDFAIQAMSGLMSITGAADGSPQKVGVAIADVIAGLNAAIAILAAWHHRQQTGKGQYIDIALLDTQIAALVNVASNYLVSGQTPARYGNAHPNIVPYQTFAAQDGAFVLAVGNDKQFRSLCALIGHPEWADDPLFASNPARVMNRERLIPLLASIFLGRTAEAWVMDLLKHGIPCAPIYSVAEALDNPHVSARQLLGEWGDGETRYVASPLKMSVTPPQMRTPPPTLGADTNAVLSDVLGFSAQKIADLHERQII